MSTIRCASWNVNSLKVRLPQVLDWIKAASIDALVLQETKMTDKVFPHEAIEAAGYECAFIGQKTYNGVAILVKRETMEPMEVLTKNIPGYPDEQKRLIAAVLRPRGAKPEEAFTFVGGYFPNGSEPSSQKFLYKLDWLEALTVYLKTQLAQTPRLLLGGDFNIAPEDKDCWNPMLFRNQVLCTPQERGAFRQLEALKLVDTFRALHPDKKDRYSWWDYRSRAFEQNQGVRIDHILASEALMPQVRASLIDEDPRHNPQPSDHAPVVVELSF